MKNCDAIKPLLALSAGSDLDPARRESAENHLATCQTCRSEHQKFLGVITAARGVRKYELTLPTGVRNKIAADAAAHAARPRPFPWLLFPAGGFSLRPGTLAAVTACLVVLLAMPILRRELTSPVRDGEVAPRIEVVADGQVVRLAWVDGQRESYTVFKSTDPRSTTKGEAHVVRGNVWVDQKPNSSPVVFYRIE